MKRAAHSTVICVALLVGLFGGTMHATTAISSCFKITHPGSYVLTGNITATASNVICCGISGLPACILIAADFVTLNLNGFAVTNSTAPSAHGISTDKNLTTGNAVDHYGIYVYSGTVANFPGVGVYLFGAGHTVEHIRAVRNGEEGIWVRSFSDPTMAHRIVGNTAISNGGGGIFVACPAVVLENVAAGNPAGADILEFGSGCTNAENNPNLP